MRCRAVAGGSRVAVGSSGGTCFLSLPRVARLSIPPGAVLLRRNGMTSEVCLVQGNYLHLFFGGRKQSVAFRFFFRKSFITSFSDLCRQAPDLFSLRDVRPTRLSIVGQRSFFEGLKRGPTLQRVCRRGVVRHFRICRQLFLSHVGGAPRRQCRRLLGRRPSVVRQVPRRCVTSCLKVASISLSEVEGEQ